MSKDCPDCVRNIVHLHDGWEAHQVDRNLWKLENPARDIGVGVFTSFQQIQDYLKELERYD